MDGKTIQRGYFEKETIQWIKVNSEYNNYSKGICSLLLLELWHRIFIDNTALL